METSERPQSQERLPDTVIAPPAGESLFEPDAPDSLWPESVRNDPALRQEAERRKELHDGLAALFDRIVPGNIPIESAVESGAVSPAEAAAALRGLSALLDSDPTTARLALYLPFEVLPPVAWQPADRELAEAAQAFVDSFMRSWYGLLTMDDIRANFVDGDVPESGLRDTPPPRVTKAAHLIPVLMKKGYLTLSDAADMMRGNKGSTLERSIADTMPTLEDMGLVSRAEMERLSTMHGADEEIPENMVRMTDARAKWLKQKEEDEAVQRDSDLVAKGLADGSLAIADVPLTAAGAHGMRKAIERDIARYPEFRETLSVMWESGDEKVRDALESTWSHLYHLKIVDTAELASRGIPIPDPDAPFKNRAEALAGDTSAVAAVAEAIERDPELSKFLMPVSILFGSRMKGYGSRGADLDFAVFVRPGTNPAQRERIRELLAKTEPAAKLGAAIEFWLEETPEGLAVRELPDADPSVTEASWAHVLFQGAWCGDKGTIAELHEKLLARYLASNDDAARARWLEELEKDTLQYRLMHRGYARLYPPQGGLPSSKTDAIDGSSAFYDSGFRRLATLLYVHKVFLPKLGAKA